MMKTTADDKQLPLTVCHSARSAEDVFHPFEIHPSCTPLLCEGPSPCYQRNCYSSPRQTSLPHHHSPAKKRQSVCLQSFQSNLFALTGVNNKRESFTVLSTPAYLAAVLFFIKSTLGSPTRLWPWTANTFFPMMGPSLMYMI